MSRLKMVSASCLSLILASTLFLSPSAFADEPLKPLSVSPSESVASFLSHMFPAAEFLTGATLMSLQNVPVVGAFAHDAGVYLLLGAAFDEGADLAKIAETAGANPTIAHAGSASVLFIAGNWIFRNGAPVTASDWNAIFTRAATTNEVSASLKDAIVHNSKASVKTAWNQPLQLWIANLAAVLATGPMAGAHLEDQTYLAGVHRSAIITATYRTADLAGVAMQSFMGTSEPATTFFKGITLTAGGWALINYAAQPHRFFNPDNSFINVVGENLVEASFLGIAASIIPAVEAAAKSYAPKYPETAAFIASSALAGGFWAYARNYQPNNRLVRQAESGVRLGYILFTVAPRLKDAFTFACGEFATTYGDSVMAAYNQAKSFVTNLGQSNDKKEL